MAAVSEIWAIFKIAIFGHDTWPSAKVPEVAHIASFYPRWGAKLNLFLLYGQRFLSYEPIFKIALFGHETWLLAKVTEVANLLPKLPPPLPKSLTLKNPKFLKTENMIWRYGG